MRNRAKCKLCESVIESYGTYDFVQCKCGEIFVDGGPDYLRCGANDFTNFIRIDEEGNEVSVVKVLDLSQPSEVEKSREEKLEMINSMLKYYDDMPQHALLQAVNHYDLKAIYLMIKSLL